MWNYFSDYCFQKHLNGYLKGNTVNKKIKPCMKIAKQLSGLNTLSLSNNKNYGLKKSGVFPL